MKAGDIVNPVTEFPIPDGWTFLELRSAQRALWEAGWSHYGPYQGKRVAAIVNVLWNN